MESPHDQQLLSPDYWDSDEVDVRLNPLAPFDREGLDEFLASEVRLRGHVIFATSGSSGAPKLVCLSRSALLASADAVNAHLEATERDRWLCGLPQFHVGGYGIWTRARQLGGQVESYLGAWSALSFCDQIQAFQATLTSLVPVQVFDIVRAGVRCPPTLRVVLVGGGALSPQLGQAARDLGWPVLQTYGMTEAASQVATQKLNALTSKFENAPLPVLDGWEVRSDALSRLQLRGRWLFTGYIERQPGGWRFSASPGAGGWFTSEDLGTVETIDGAAFLRISGRGGRTVKVLGELVNLNPLEDLLVEFADATGDAMALETIDDERMGKRVVLVVEDSVSKKEIQDLIERFNERVAPFERIRGVARLKEIPRSPLGKIQRRRLAKMLDGVVTW